MSDRVKGAPRGNRNRVTHGQRRSPEYTAWPNAKQRVTNRKLRWWARYGGRGIGMCSEWMASFTAFLAHVGPRPGRGYSLDRIDNDRGYEPGNVRWATAAQQAANREVA